MLIHPKKDKEMASRLFLCDLFFYDCSKVFLAPFLPFDSQEKNLCPPLCF